MNKNKELIIIDKISKKLKEKRKETVFPLSPTHRKELRNLRDSNIGSLRNRLSNIQQLKQEEYRKKYNKEIEKEFLGKTEVCKKLNDNWIFVIKSINDILVIRKEKEEKLNTKFLNLNNDYGDISSLKNIDKSRKFSFDKKFVCNKIADDEFIKKYEKSFNKVKELINKLDTQYEEAINFGDLEIVKQLYYYMKNSDKLFLNISNLKI